ncbi:methyltransferase domain-containing protein [Colwelliaceae bacterium 6471]
MILKDKIISIHSPLLSTYLDTVKQVSTMGHVLDLACGRGRNGLYLLANDIAVTFADINATALEELKNDIAALHPSIDVDKREFWLVDFEQGKDNVFANRQFAAVLVFRYLHRPLFSQLKQAILPGGLVIYETFTREQAAIGRPKRAEFLLEKDELAQIFSDWNILYKFEGIVDKTDGSGKQAIAQIVAQKPLTNHSKG